MEKGMQTRTCFFLSSVSIQVGSKKSTVSGTGGERSYTKLLRVRIQSLEINVYFNSCLFSGKATEERDKILTVINNGYFQLSMCNGFPNF